MGMVRMRVMMLGPSFEARGGMTSVSKVILSHDFADFEVEHLPTMHDNSILGRLNHWAARIVSWPFRSVYKRPNVVHIHFAERLSIWRKLSLMLLWRISRVPVVLHSHGADTMDLYPKMWRVSKFLFKRFLRGSKKLIVLSESWKDFYVREVGLSEGMVEVLENPVILPDMFRTGDCEKITILYSGRIGRRKGAFDLIEAWRKIGSTNKERAELIIIGDGKIEEARKMVDEFGLEESCKVLGWVSEEEKNSILSSSRIFILPSFNEGLPMSLLEAMSYALAPIITPVGGIPNIIEEGVNGTFVVPGDADSIAVKLERMISDQEMAKVIGDNARNSVHSLGIDEYGPKLERIWSNVSLIGKG